MKKDDVFWGLENEEILSFTDPEEALKDCFDRLDPLPRKVKIYKYVRVKIKEDWRYYSDLISDFLWENLEDRYGDFEQGNTPSEEFSKATDLYAKTVIDSYAPWQCERTSEYIEFDVEDWVKKYATELIEKVIGE